MRFFLWFRAAIRNSFLAGVNDALEQLSEAASQQPQEEVALQLSLTVTEAKNRIGGKGGKP